MSPAPLDIFIKNNKDEFSKDAGLNKREGAG